MCRCHAEESSLRTKEKQVRCRRCEGRKVARKRARVMGWCRASMDIELARSSGAVKLPCLNMCLVTVQCVQAPERQECGSVWIDVCRVASQQVEKAGCVWQDRGRGGGNLGLAPG
ncbi:unnamed protein product [Ostreobium quekettii]|uniref:Uncharacterized protein n=1 Tax=Ostreobium quekettii TaxID=121088 RepID=A0A8S1J608_9CHLO|nr:unnamed protein product [Ostreobium quekettii]|eukprot:evm.model.scf_1213.5 EVM.evm.TU.scf_1213.5   scf_1213:31605-31949(+)